MFTPAAIVRHIAQATAEAAAFRAAGNLALGSVRARDARLMRGWLAAIEAKAA